MRPHEEISTSVLIDKMFEDVLQAADIEEEEEEKEEEEEGVNDSTVFEAIEAETELKMKSPTPSLGGDEEACDGEQSECEDLKEEEEEEEEKGTTEEKAESAVCNEEDFLSLPLSCILSPLSKSVEAVVTPMVSSGL